MKCSITANLQLFSTRTIHHTNSNNNSQGIVVKNRSTASLEDQTTKIDQAIFHLPFVLGSLVFRTRLFKK